MRDAPVRHRPVRGRQGADLERAAAEALTPEPDWLAGWRRSAIPPAEALARFDALPVVMPEAMLGRWRGAGLATGHVLDGVLEALGWWGKAFEGVDRVHPLLFRHRGDVVPLEPALMPTGPALRFPWLAPRSRAARRIFRALVPVLKAKRPGARLERRRFRGRESAAMVYQRQPIVDHFRAIDPARLLGLMERPGMPEPFFFLLVRNGPEA